MKYLLVEEKGRSGERLRWEVLVNQSVPSGHVRGDHRVNFACAVNLRQATLNLIFLLF